MEESSALALVNCHLGYDMYQNSLFTLRACVLGVYMCLNGGVYVPWHMCGGSRTTLGVCPYLLPCLRQDLLFIAVYIVLVGLLVFKGILLSPLPTLP